MQPDIIIIFLFVQWQWEQADLKSWIIQQEPELL